jgi:hypothetical protein
LPEIPFKKSERELHIGLKLAQGKIGRRAAGAAIPLRATQNVMASSARRAHRSREMMGAGMCANKGVLL